MPGVESELCTLLVNDLFGEFHSRIFSVLLKHGRLQIPQIGQRTHMTGRSVRNGLIVLLQANLIHHIPGENGAVLYEADLEHAYNLIRVGRIVSLIERKYGVRAARIILHLLHHGDTEAGELRNAMENGSFFSAQYAEVNAHTNMETGFVQSTPNTFPAKHERYRQQRVGEFELAIFRLTKNRLLQKVKAVPIEYGQPTDRESRNTIHNRIDGVVQTGPADLADNQRDERTRYKKGTKRKADEADNMQRLSASKRAKAMGPISDQHPAMLMGESSSDASSQQNSISRYTPASHEKLSILLRNQALQSLADTTVAEGTARVYAAILNQLQRKTESRYGSPQDDSTIYASGQQPSHQPKVDIRTLGEEIASDSALKIMDEDVQLDPGQLNGYHREEGQDETVDIPNGDMMEPVNCQHAASSDDLVYGHTNGLNSDKDSDWNHTNKGKTSKRKEDPFDDIDYHLAVLAESNPRFIEKRRIDNRFELVVPFESLARTLRSEEVLRFVTARFGRVAARLVRLLMEKGKTDERILQELALITTRETRQTLSQLKQAGFIELQEIAREVQRNPSRALFFWFYDEERACRLVLERSIAGMIKCLRRLDFEREKVMSILMKSARFDVRGREEMYMEKHEFEKFRRWKNKEERFLSELDRLDHLVSVLKLF